MSKNKKICLYVSKETHDKAKKIFKNYGMTVSKAIEMYISQAVIQGKPFGLEPPVPERLIIKNNDDLIKKLKEAEKDFDLGRVFNFDDVCKELREILKKASDIDTPHS